MIIKGLGRFLLIAAISAMIPACGASIDMAKGPAQADGAKLSFIWPEGYGLDQSTGKLIKPSAITGKTVPEYITRITLSISGEGMDSMTLDVPLDTLYVTANVSFGVRRFDVVVDTSIGSSFTGSQTAEIAPHATPEVVITLEVNAPPTLDTVNISNTSPLPGETITLTASAHDMDTDDVLSYRWEITGPGGARTFTGQSVTVTLPVTGGDYLIVLIIEDGHGGVTRAQKSVRLSGNPPVINKVGMSNPMPALGETVSIWADVTDPDQGDYFTYSWGFKTPSGGYTTAQGYMVSYTFAESGTYTITLVVKDQQGNTDDIFNTVTIGCTYPTPQAPAITSASSTAAGAIMIYFTYPGNSVTDGIVVYNLQFYEATSMTGTPITNSGWIGSISTASPIVYTCVSGKYYQFQVGAGNACYVAGPMSASYPPPPNSWVLCM